VRWHLLPRLAARSVADSRAAPGPVDREDLNRLQADWLRKAWPELEQNAKKNGVSPEELDEIRRDVFGHAV